MLTHATLDKLRALKLMGMLKALEEQMMMPDISELPFFDRLGLMVDRELTERENRRIKTKLRYAKLRQAACVEDIDYRHPRGLDKALMVSLASCQWVTSHRNVLVTGPTGAGKTYIACALANSAIRQGYTALYKRVPRLAQEAAMGRADGTYPKLMASLSRTDVLVLDDWGIASLGTEQNRDLLEVIEDRHVSRSTIIASQLPVEGWHQHIGDPTIADAILDRLVHNAHRIILKGEESMRKIYARDSQS